MKHPPHNIQMHVPADIGERSRHLRVCEDCGVQIVGEYAHIADYFLASHRNVVHCPVWEKNLRYAAARTAQRKAMARKDSSPKTIQERVSRTRAALAQLDKVLG
jgi:hypothetical protein